MGSPELTNTASAVSDVITACADQLDWLVTDMQRRAETLERYAPGANKVPKHLAVRKDLRLHPLFVFIDEVHVLFGNDQVGGKTGRATLAGWLGYWCTARMSGSRSPTGWCG